MITRTVTEHTRALLNYLPGGRLFAGRNSSSTNIYKLMTGIATECLTSDQFIKYFRTEIIPSLTEQLLPEWESALGIPDDCFKGNGDIDERRTHVLAKLASLGVQTGMDFEALAAIFGVTLEVVPGVVEKGISDPTDRFRMYIHHTEQPSDTFPLTFPIIFGSKTLSIIACLFDELKPANCSVVFREIGWDITNAVYEAQQYDVGVQDATPTGIFFKPDGTKMYMIGATNDTIYQYTLSTVWDVSTASYDSVSFSIATQDTNPGGMFFKDDGLTMYIAGSNNDTIYQYTLSTAWDISTASYASKSFSIASEDIDPTGIFFKPDGTKMYMVGNTNDAIYQYTLSTAWDVSTASYDSVSFSIATQDTNPGGMFFKDDGTKMYMVGRANDAIYQYTLSAAWNLSTASYDSVSFSVVDKDGSPEGLFFKPDGTKMYFVGQSNNRVYEYELPTAWLLTGATHDEKKFSIVAQETIPTDVQFKPDGTKMYIIGNANDTVYQYTLSTAWDVSTASYDIVSFSISTQDTSPLGLFFKGDGTTMYMVGSSTGTVYQYALSTAWDVSTASYASKSISVSAQDISPQGIFFSDDGAKMYMVGDFNDTVYQYTLSTAWDVSTASYDIVSFSVTTQDTWPSGLTFKSDGTKMYMVGNTNDTIYQYSLSNLWDLSTASYDSVSFSITAEDISSSGLFLKPDDGTKMYMVGFNTDAIYQYRID